MDRRRRTRLGSHQKSHPHRTNRQSLQLQFQIECLVDARTNKIRPADCRHFPVSMAPDSDTRNTGTTNDGYFRHDHRRIGVCRGGIGGMRGELGDVENLIL